MFHLAILKITMNRANSRLIATRLLEKATRDNDYPKASKLISKFVRVAPNLSVCWRFLRPQLSKRMCPLHQAPSDERLALPEVGHRSGELCESSKLHAPSQIFPEKVTSDQTSLGGGAVPNAG